MSVVWHFTRPKVPLRGLMLSFAALTIPVVQTLLPGPSRTDADQLLWLVALIPAFLLAYYQGRRGVATALAVGMAVLAVTHVVAVALGSGPPDLLLVFGVAATFAGTCLGIGWLSEVLHRQRERAERVALTDDLTGIWNRRRARMHLNEAFGRVAAKGGQSLAVVMFDLDKFKSFNDLHGHPAGDALLVRFAEALARCTPEGDLSARYGGEEFLSVLSSYDLAGAVGFADRVRSVFRETQVQEPRLTVCAGVTMWHPGMRSRNELLIAADRGLYLAKQSGRDCVRVYDAQEPDRQAG